MICRICRSAGDSNKSGDFDWAKSKHTECECPNSCTCQHRVGKEHVIREETKEG